MSAELLDEQYLTWLYKKVGFVKETDPKKTYWKLLKQLYTKEFVWFVPNDDNRVEDGRDLRNEFLHDGKFKKVTQDWLDMGCSVLEMLISVARILEFQAEGNVKDWFWHLIDNLGMTKYTDSYYRAPFDQENIDEKLNRLIWRQYSYDGSFGGLFPLQFPDQDQRDVEIWYQLCNYVIEKGYV